MSKAFSATLKLTTAERDALASVPTDTVILNLTVNLFQKYNGATWDNLSNAAGSPGGANTEIQFNNSGVFGASNSFRFLIASTSLALGNTALAAGAKSFSMGTTSPSASGAASFAQGDAVTASGDYAHAHGYSNTSSGNRSFTSGQSNVASGPDSTALGSSSSASAQSAIALCSANVSGDYAFGAGEGAKADGYSQVAVGRFNVAQGTSGSYVAGDDAFIVGNGSSGGARSNAFSVSNDGKVRTQREIYQPATPAALAAAFIISPDKSYVRVSSTADRTSDAVTAIAAGSEVGQRLIIEMISAFNLTFKQDALVKLPSGVDYILSQYGSISLIWNGTVWITTGVSAN